MSKTTRTLRAPGGGGGITAAQAQTALSEGGSNPITETGALTVHEPFVVEDATGHDDFTIVNDPGLGPVVTIDGLDDLADVIVLRANGAQIEQYDNANNLVAYLNGEGYTAGIGITVADNTLAAFSLRNDAGAGLFIMQDAAQVAKVNWSLTNDALGWDHVDGSGVDWDATSLILSADHTDNSGNSLLLAAGQLSLRDAFGSPVIQAFGAGTVGFFAATPVGQSAAGTTTADAIACLKAFGFMAT